MHRMDAPDGCTGWMHRISLFYVAKGLGKLVCTCECVGCKLRTRLLLRLPDWVGIMALAGLGGYSGACRTGWIF
jgi:hypothetical protein